MWISPHYVSSRSTSMRSSGCHKRGNSQLYDRYYGVRATGKDENDVRIQCFGLKGVVKMRRSTDERGVNIGIDLCQMSIMSFWPTEIARRTFLEHEVSLIGTEALTLGPWRTVKS